MRSGLEGGANRRKEGLRPKTNPITRNAKSAAGSRRSEAARNLRDVGVTEASQPSEAVRNQAYNHETSQWSERAETRRAERPKKADGRGGAAGDVDGGQLGSGAGKGREGTHQVDSGKEEA